MQKHSDREQKFSAMQSLYKKTFSVLYFGDHNITVVEVNIKTTLLPLLTVKSLHSFWFSFSLSITVSLLFTVCLSFPSGRQAAVPPQAGIQTRPQLQQDRRTLRQQIMKMWLCVLNGTTLP